MEISAVVFDMDGVLIDARDWHFEAFNEALSIFIDPITYEEHLLNFDGLPTRAKLKALAEQGRISEGLFGIVEAVKQERTMRIAASKCRPTMEHLIVLGWLKQKGIKLGVATNSIRQTSQAMLSWAGILEMFDTLVTNEDVVKAKPDPEIYLKACSALGTEPKHCLVIEDNPIGIEAASQAGCKVRRVSGPTHVTLEMIRRELGI